ncbi:MOSC domain-containing protein [Coniella lustricola]|uniref:MOSC domain-containing protein n=1 Tax=Coniella lustricola TaxID=2025994 RepID=A0A2T3AAY0_9PEZI|nr:MOSC domain-containing protein [Coniella lustricola]
MAVGEDIDLWSPFKRDTILEVRSGKLKKYKGLNIESGIDKTLLDGPVHIGKLGIDGDEHDLTFHGGVDKAVHGYCCTHYPTWASEFPTASTRFVPGGFGENLVTAHMNERNVCIGDIVSIGPDPDAGPLLQVSLPRQPCFKLNLRFELKNFAPNTWRTSRTGWYYRVLREGWVSAGDEIRLVERRHPKWTIERIQEYLHRNTGVLSVNEELAAIAEFGAESHDAFARRVAKQQAKERREKEGGADGTLAKSWRNFRVVEKMKQTQRVTSFILEAVEAVPEEQAALNEGAHAKIRLPIPGRAQPLVRSYSIVSGDCNRLEFGISLDANSRGGSRYLHENVQVGDTLQVGRITAMHVTTAASCHVFVVAGIGITAFLDLALGLRKYNFAVKLHYAVRSAADDVPFRDRIDTLGASDVVTIYDKTAGERLSIAKILREMPWNSRVYFCGPSTFMEEARRETKAAGLTDEECHFESFGAADDVLADGDPFEAIVTQANSSSSRNQRIVKVGGEETLLEVLQRTFGDEAVPSSCEVGNCGTCKIRLKKGRVEHRGTGLPEDEKGENMLACVSRGLGQIEVEI